MQVNTNYPDDAIRKVRELVKEKTGHDVLEATVVDPFNWRTRAWTNQVILNRTYDSLPPNKDS